MSLLYSIKKFLLLKRYRSQENFTRFYAEIDAERKVKDTPFTVVDTETTSPDPRKAGLLSVGAIQVRNLSLELSTAFHRFIFQEDIERESIEVHGITRDEILKLGEPPEAVLEDFLKYAKGTVLVGFNIEFDRIVIERHLKRLFRIPLPMPRLDVSAILKRTEVRGRTLEDIAKELDTPVEAVHSALDDAYTTSLLFLKLVHPFRESPLSSLPIMF